MNLADRRDETSREVSDSLVHFVAVDLAVDPASGIVLAEPTGTELVE